MKVMGIDPVQALVVPRNDDDRREDPMIFTQHYLDCLSQGSYLIGDETNGRAVVVDPAAISTST